MKQFFVSLGALALFPFSTLASFSDVSEDHRFYDAIEFVERGGIVQGYSDGTYKPEVEINRAEFTKIIVNAFSINGTDWILAGCQLRGDIFNDISYNPIFTGPGFPENVDWYDVYICKAKEMGIVNGYADGSFRPGNTITLPEAIKIITIAADIDVSEYGYRSLNTWDNSYLDYYFQKINDNDIIPPMGGDYDLDEARLHSISRGEMAYFIQQIKALKQEIMDSKIKEIEDNLTNFYSNYRFGFSLSYPSAFAIDMENLPTNGDGVYILGPQMKITASGANNSLQDTLLSYRIKNEDWIEKGGNIVFGSGGGKESAYLKWENNGKLFYKKIFVGIESINSITFEYNKGVADVDLLIDAITNSFTPGDVNNFIY